MKKIIVLLIVFIILCVSFSGCKSTEDTNSSKTSQSVQQVETTRLRAKTIDDNFFIPIQYYDDCAICYDPVNMTVWIRTKVHGGGYVFKELGKSYSQYMEWYESNNN